MPKWLQWRRYLWVYPSAEGGWFVALFGKGWHVTRSSDGDAPTAFPSHGGIDRTPNSYWKTREYGDDA